MKGTQTDMDATQRNSATIQTNRRKPIRVITHEQAVARSKREADAYFALKPDSATEQTVFGDDRKKLPGIKWKVSHYRRDKRTGATRRVRPSFYVHQLMKAEARKHGNS